MKSLLPVCKRVKPFIAENKELVAGITVVNLIFFILTFTNVFIFNILFLLVFSYSNFRVLKLFSHEAPTKNFLATQVKFFVLTVIEYFVLCFGVNCAFDTFVSPALPLLASIVLGVIITIITVYILLLIQASLVSLFVNGTGSYNVLKFSGIFCKAQKALSLYGEQHRSHMISLFTFFFTVLLLLGICGAYSKLYAVIIFAIASFCVSVYNVCVLPLIQDVDDEATTKANREELAQVLADNCGCDSSKAESDCHKTCAKVCGNIVNPEFYLKVIGVALYFILYSIPGAFQYVYALIDDIITGHNSCKAERAAKKKANSQDATEQAAPATTENEDSLEKAFNTPIVTPEGEPNNPTDTLAEDFKLKDDEQVASTEDTAETDSNPDTLESAFEAPLQPEANDKSENKTDTVSEEFQTISSYELEAQAEFQAEELANEEVDQAKAEVETVEEEIAEATTSLESTVYPFPEIEKEDKAEDKKADK